MNGQFTSIRVDVANIREISMKKRLFCIKDRAFPYEVILTHKVNTIINSYNKNTYMRYKTKEECQRTCDKVSQAITNNRK